MTLGQLSNDYLQNVILSQLRMNEFGPTMSHLTCKDQLYFQFVVVARRSIGQVVTVIIGQPVLMHFGKK